MEEKLKYEDLTDSERQFLKQANNPAVRANLLERLERLGLLAAFLQVEIETI